MSNLSKRYEQSSWCKGKSGRGGGRCGAGYVGGRGHRHADPRDGHHGGGREAGGAHGYRLYNQGDPLNNEDYEVGVLQCGTPSKHTLPYVLEYREDQLLDLKSPPTPTLDIDDNISLAPLVRKNAFGKGRHKLRLLKCSCGKSQTYVCTHCTQIYCTLKCSKIGAIADSGPQFRDMGFSPPVETPTLPPENEQTETTPMACASAPNQDGEIYSAVELPMSPPTILISISPPQESEKSESLKGTYSTNMPIEEPSSSRTIAVAISALTAVNISDLTTAIHPSKHESSLVAPMPTGHNAELLATMMSSASSSGSVAAGGVRTAVGVGKGRRRGRRKSHGDGAKAGLGRGHGRARDMPRSVLGLARKAYPAERRAELGIGSDITVVVSHVESPSDFYIICTSDLPKLEFIEKEIENLENREFQGEIAWELLIFPKVGDICITNLGGYKKRDGREIRATFKYRARIVECHPDASTVKIQLLDYGHIVEHSRSQLKRLPASLVEIPGLANRVLVKELMPKRPASDGKWPRAAIRCFVEMVDEPNQCTFRPFLKIGNSYVGKLTIGEHDVAKEIVKSGFGKFSRVSYKLNGRSDKC